MRSPNWGRLSKPSSYQVFLSDAQPRSADNCNTKDALCFFCVQAPESVFFLANADVLICFAMQSPSVIQKSLPRLRVKDRTSSCGRTILSSVLLFSSQEDCPAVGERKQVGDSLLD